MIGDRINDRLRVAMTPETVAQPEAAAAADTPEAKSPGSDVTVQTSPEEVEAFHIVRAILRGVVAPKRVFMRDAQSYCAIILDDNNRKPICRLRFNNTAKLAIGLMSDKDEEKVALADLDDIYNHADKIKATVTGYL